MDILEHFITIKKYVFSRLGVSGYLPFAVVIGGFTLGFFSFLVGVYAIITLSNPKKVQANVQAQSNPTQEKPSDSFSEKKIEVAGAVLNPGVYTFQSGERVVDAIEKAGGLDKKADERFLSKNLNKAAKLQDEEKIYIPTVGEKIQLAPASSAGSSQNSRQSSATVSINSASLAEIMELEGIGEVRAQKVISNRPYGSIEELVDKDVLTSKIFSNIKNQLVL